MTEIKNPLEIYQLLPKTNCGHCGVPSCMAFAAQILQGLKAINDCPYLPRNSVSVSVHKLSADGPRMMNMRRSSVACGMKSNCLIFHAWRHA